MRYAPFENFTITTSLPVEEAKQRLLEQVEIRQSSYFNTDKSTKPYTGKIVISEFVISRNAQYRNSFLPVIKMRFEREGNSTMIPVTMRPVTFVLVFMGIWLSGASIACIAAISSLLFPSTGVTGFSGVELIPFGMLIFGYGLMTIAFKVESSKSRKFLEELFC